MTDEVLVTQLALPEYRQELLNVLDEGASKIRFLCGDQQFYEFVSQGVQSPLVEETGPNVFLLGRKFVWQRNVLWRTLRARMVVVDLNPRILSSWVILFLRKGLHRSTAGWGHAFARSGPDARSNVVRRVMQRLCSTLVTYTDSERDALAKLLPRQRILVAPNAIYRKEFMQYEPAVERIDVVLIGRLVPEKKPMLGVKGFESVLPWLPARTRLHVIGDGPLLQEIHAYVESAGLEGRVVVHGAIFDWKTLREIFSNCYCMIAPGYVGLNVTQALGFGVPVVYAREEPHAPEIEALNQENSRAFDSNQASDLGYKMLEVLELQLAGEMDAEEISSYARSNYSSEAMSQAFLEIEKISGRSGGIRALLPHTLKRRLALARSEVALRAGVGSYSWPALHGLDRQLAEVLPSEGVFFEVGANDGFSQSNTYHLEKLRDWQGILVEPIPRLLRRCKAIRRKSVCYGVALVSPDSAGSFIEIADSDLTSVALGMQEESREEVRLEAHKARVRLSVPTSTITQVVEASGFDKVDFMSIDVEGAEVEVLKGLDKTRFCPTWLLVETKCPDEVTALLEPQMALAAKMSHHDYLYRIVE